MSIQEAFISIYVNQCMLNHGILTTVNQIIDEYLTLNFFQTRFLLNFLQNESINTKYILHVFKKQINISLT